MNEIVEPQTNAVTPKQILGINDIKKYLPHRFPFLHVDRVISYEPGKSICGIKNVTVNEPFFIGHFPEQPVMPGVIIIEALAQISGVLYFLTTNNLANDKAWFYFAGIDKAKFKRVVYPGDQLMLHSEMVKNKLDIWVFNVKATVNGEVACLAEIKVAKGELKHD